MQVGDTFKLYDEIVFAAGPVIPADEEVTIIEVKDSEIVCAYDFAGPYDSNYHVTFRLDLNEVDYWMYGKTD